MKISHVIRGEEHLSNTPKQILLYEALNEQIPYFAHLPLILNKDGKKLSKRDAATSVIDYKNLGILPEALLCYLIRLGWSYGDQEIFTFEELLKYFDLKKIHSSGAIFDIQKLFWINSCFIKKLSDEEIYKKIFEYNLVNNNFLNNWKIENKLKCINLYKNRAESLNDIINFSLNVFNGPENFEFKKNLKFIEIENNKKILKIFIKTINENIFNDLNLIKEFVKNLCEENSIEQSTFFKLLRFFILGKIESPSIYEIINIIGFEETKKRILNNV